MSQQNLRIQTLAVLFPLLFLLPLACQSTAPRAESTDQIQDSLRTGSYRFQNNWLKLPEKTEQLGPVHGGIAVDGDGRVFYTTNGDPHPIMKHARDGTFQKGLADSFPGCHDLVLRRENGQTYLYAAHLHGKQILKLKPDGTVVWRIPFKAFKQSGKYEKPSQFKPTSVAVGPDGDVFVADGYGANWIHQFDEDRTYIRSFGGPGTKPGKFQTCHGISIDPRYDDPRLLVCDRENRRIQHFDLDGNFLEVITKGLRRPCAVSFLNGYVAVAELEARVTILNRQNEPITHLGANPNKDQWANYNVPREKWKPDQFTAPHAIRFDRSTGALYVMDWNRRGRVRKLVPVRK